MANIQSLESSNKGEMTMPECTYTVFVGGCEVNDFLLTKQQARNLAQEYIDDGYDDVCVQLA